MWLRRLKKKLIHFSKKRQKKIKNQKLRTALFFFVSEKISQKKIPNFFVLCSLPIKQKKKKNLNKKVAQRAF
jgi:cAMP phosphodiesterase